MDNAPTNLGNVWKCVYSRRMAKAPETVPWRSRIIGHGEEDPEQLVANPLNWRIHPRTQQEALEGLLDGVGWVGEVLVNQRTGFVVDGHLRISLALRRHEGKVPVTYCDLSEDEEMLVLAMLDPIAAAASTDHAKLDELLREVSVQDERVKVLLDHLRDGVDAEGYTPPSFDKLRKDLGEGDDFSGYIKVEATPEMLELYTDLCKATGQVKPTEAMAKILEAAAVVLLSMPLSES